MISVIRGDSSTDHRHRQLTNTGRYSNRYVFTDDSTNRDANKIKILLVESETYIAGFGSLVHFSEPLIDLFA